MKMKNIDLLEFLLHYLAGVAIFFGIIILLLSAIIHPLSSIGWILIIFGCIWAVNELTIFKHL